MTELEFRMIKKQYSKFKQANFTKINFKLINFELVFYKSNCKLNDLSFY